MFNGIYAKLYDEFHSLKDYRKEVELITRQLNMVGRAHLKGLDFGCGTGNHAALFGELDIVVDGFDVSESMVEVARTKHPNLRFSTNLADLDSSYDFAYCLFDVLSYQTTVNAAKKVLEALYTRTKASGQVLIDSWNLSGVRLSPPRITSRSVESSIGTITRHVRPLDMLAQDVYALNILLIKDSREGGGGEVIDNSIHQIRAWSPEEVVSMLEEAGFYAFDLYNPANPSAEPQAEDWRFGVRARK
jgi:SAM-dependent methyltransferase